MNEVSLICFLRACELHNLSKAAQELHISQPALSRRIIALEDELGINLLNRSNTGVELTDGGKLFYKEAKKLVHAERGLREKMKEYQKGLVGSLTIGCDSKDDVEPLIRAAKRLKEQVPGMELEFKDLSHDQAIYQYLQKNIDIAYVHKCNVPELKESAVEIVARNHPVISVSRGHRLWERTSVSLADLAGESIVFSDIEQTEAACITQAAELQGLSWNPVVACESHATRMFQVLSGHAISIGGTYSADRLKAFEPEIRIIPITDVSLDDADYCVIYQSSDANSTLFIRCLKQLRKTEL